MIITNCLTKQKLMEIIKEDHFHKDKLIENSIIEFMPNRGTEDFIAHNN